METPGVAPTGIAASGLKVTGVLLDWGLPIATFLVGVNTYDPFSLANMVNDFLPPQLKGTVPTVIGNIPILIAASFYFLAAYLAIRFVPYLGRAVAGLFAGFGVKTLFRGLSSSVAGGMVPEKLR